MLKIKAEKMGELEKMGYRYDELYKSFFKYIAMSSCNLNINKLSRMITIENMSTADMNGCHYEILEEFYNLIKADMVEDCDD